MRLSDDEKKRYSEDGFLVRREVFSEGDLEPVRAACEELAREVQARYREGRQERGGYYFNIDPDSGLIVKWEGEKDVIMGLEIFMDLNDTVRQFAADARWVEPMKDIVGAEEVTLFTEKLNMKRAREGGPIVLHQDWPYWTASSDDVASIATACLYLDDATVDNGCLLAAPGSHKLGVLPVTDEAAGDRSVDASQFDASGMVPLEAPAGSLVFLGPLLVHRSLNNNSDHDRRALLFSYQPAGRPHIRDARR